MKPSTDLSSSIDQSSDIWEVLGEVGGCRKKRDTLGGVHRHPRMGGSWRWLGGVLEVR